MEDNKTEYFIEYIDANEMVFYLAEIEDIKNNFVEELGGYIFRFEPTKKDNEYLADYLIKSIIRIDLFSEYIDFTQKRKIEFLEAKLKSIEKDNKEIPFEDSEIQFLDYSGNKIAERITVLNEIGIINYLRKLEPFNVSTNRLAELLSLFMNEEQTTIQSYINPIVNGENGKNNPLTSKNIKNVHLKLGQIGMNPKNFMSKVD